MDREVLEHYVEHFNKQAGQKYPCSNQVVVCGVITRDKDKALDFMKDKEFVKKREKYDCVEWTLTNGERWHWRKWNEGCRGYRFYKIAIDENISDRMFNFFVRPYCSLYCCSMEII